MVFPGDDLPLAEAEFRALDNGRKGLAVAMQDGGRCGRVPGCVRAPGRDSRPSRGARHSPHGRRLVPVAPAAAPTAASAPAVPLIPPTGDERLPRSCAADGCRPHAMSTPHGALASRQRPVGHNDLSKETSMTTAEPTAEPEHLQLALFWGATLAALAIGFAATIGGATVKPLLDVPTLIEQATAGGERYSLTPAHRSTPPPHPRRTSRLDRAQPARHRSHARLRPR